MTWFIALSKNGGNEFLHDGRCLQLERAAYSQWLQQKNQKTNAASQRNKFDSTVADCKLANRQDNSKSWGFAGLDYFKPPAEKNRKDTPIHKSTVAVARLAPKIILQKAESSPIQKSYPSQQKQKFKEHAKRLWTGLLEWCSIRPITEALQK